MLTGLPKLICVDPARVAEFWPFAFGYIKAAMDRTKLGDFRDIEAAVLRGEFLLWLAVDTISNRIEAACVTQQLKDHVVIVACGGLDLKRWVHLLEPIEKYAAAEGCKWVRIYGRKGWERALDGYHAKHVILEKLL